MQVSGRINGVDNISSDTDGTNTRIHIFLANLFFVSLTDSRDFDS